MTKARITQTFIVNLFIIYYSKSYFLFLHPYHPLLKLTEIMHCLNKAQYKQNDNYKNGLYKTKYF
jgi:hypothetical protein